MRRVLLGAVVGGVLLFGWGAACWMVLDVHRLDVEPMLPNEEAVLQALEGTERGVYWIPGGSQDTEPNTPEWEAWAERHRKGPIGFLLYDPEGAEPMPASMMAIGLGLCLLVALVAALILRGASVRTFMGRFFTIFGMGVVIVLFVDGQSWNWMRFPNDWVRGAVLDHLGGFAVLGLALAAIVKPKPVS